MTNSDEQKPREFWIELRPSYTVQFAYKSFEDLDETTTANNPIHVIEKSAYDDLAQENERLREVCGDLMNALEKHHNEWSDNDTCLAECTKLCNALESAKDKLGGGV